MKLYKNYNKPSQNYKKKKTPLFSYSIDAVKKCKAEETSYPTRTSPLCQYLKKNIKIIT